MEEQVVILPADLVDALFYAAQLTPVETGGGGVQVVQTLEEGSVSLVAGGYFILG